MRGSRPILAAIVLAAVSLGGASSVAARTMVDPATLTPPLEPYRVCYQEGPWVKCDTSDVSVVTNEPAFELPCGVSYLSYTEIRHATRWYRDGLLVERIVQARVRGHGEPVADERWSDGRLCAEFELG